MNAQSQGWKQGHLVSPLRKYNKYILKMPLLYFDGFPAQEEDEDNELESAPAPCSAKWMDFFFQAFLFLFVNLPSSLLHALFAVCKTFPIAYQNIFMEFMLHI